MKVVQLLKVNKKSKVVIKSIYTKVGPTFMSEEPGPHIIGRTLIDILSLLTARPKHSPRRRDNEAALRTRVNKTSPGITETCNLFGKN